ncbi:MAG: CopD family protein [candidate division NC10 bacterium]|nr:CopD family protein [candidate division NC10 bacterium]
MPKGLAFVLTLHMTAIVFWLGSLMARVLMLGRLAAPGSADARPVVGLLHRRLHLFVEVPAFSVLFIAGLALLHLTRAPLTATWLLVKLLPVVALSGLDGLVSVQIKRAVGGKRIPASQPVLYAIGVVVGTALIMYLVLTKGA